MVFRPTKTQICTEQGLFLLHGYKPVRLESVTATKVQMSTVDGFSSYKN